MMHKKTGLGLLVTVICSALWLQGFTLLTPQAEVQTDDRTVRKILDTFNKTEGFLQDRNVDALMGLYSKDYNYHGLKKDDLQKVWQDLFAKYGNISSIHMFSKIVVKDATPSAADITCTGSLWATSKVTGQRVNIDSWFEEVHHLVYEAGAWRIRGHAGDAPQDLQFGVAPHPFF